MAMHYVMAGLRLGARKPVLQPRVTQYHNLWGVSGVTGTSTTRVINRIAVRKHGRYNQVGGCVRRHHTGRSLYSFVMADGSLYRVQGV